MRLFDKLNSPVIVAVVLLLILVGNGLLLYRYNTSLAESSGSGSSPGLTQTEANRAALSTPSTEPTQLVGTEGTTKDATLTTTAEATTSSSLESPKAHSVTLSVEDTPTWLLIRANGQTLLAQEVWPGFSRTFDTTGGLDVQAGDAGAVSEEVDGKDLGRLGRSGEGGNWTFR
jgi:Domain of unknown function (DUF4115)